MLRVFGMQADSVARLGCLCAAKIRLGSGSVPSETASAVSDDVEQHEEAWIDLMKLGSVFSHEGSNLYLRLWQLGQSVSQSALDRHCCCLDVAPTLNPYNQWRRQDFVTGGK